MSTLAPSSPDTDSTVRMHPVTLAAATSAVAAVVAVVGNVVIGLGETPLVIGTLLVASIAGWLNVSGRPSHRVH